MKEKARMLLRNKFFLGGLAVFIFTVFMLNCPSSPTDKATDVTTNTEPAEIDTEAVFKKLERVMPNTKVIAANPSPIEGLTEVITGEQVFYVAEDRYLVIGHIYDLQEARDLTHERKQLIKLPNQAKQPVNEARQPSNAQNRPQAQPKASIPKEEIAAAFEELEDLAVTYGSSDAPKVYIVSDPQCSFCQRLHKELYGRKDLQVFELMFPMFPNSDIKAAQVLCATEDSKPEALAKVMDGSEIEFDEVCAEEKLEQLIESRELGRALNVNGTPTIFAADGRSRAGYMPARELINWLTK